MKRILLALALWPSLALAQNVSPVTQPQSINGAYNASPQTCTTGNGCWIQTDVNGNLKTVASGTPSGTQDINIKQVGGATTQTGHGTASGAQRVELPTDGTGVVGLAAGSAVIGHVITDTTSTTAATQATASNLNAQVVGSIAAAGSDSGNPVKTGGKYNSTKPTYSDGQRSDTQSDTRGNTTVVLYGPDTNVGIVGMASNGDGTGTNATATSLRTNALGYNFNGATFDREFTCNSTAAVAVTAGNTTEIIALVSAKVIRVCSLVLSISLAGTAQIISGTGTNCGSTTANISGAINLATATPLAVSAANGSLFRSPSANAICIAAVTGNVNGFLTYAQY